MGTRSADETAAGKRHRVRYRRPGHSQTDKRGFMTKRSAQLFLACTEVSKSRWRATEIGRIQHSEVQTWVSQLSAGTAITLHPTPGVRSATHVIRAYGVLAAILDVGVMERRILVNSSCGVTLHC